MEKDQLHTGVTKQAGIYAGKEGYDIQVKNNTRLKGAVIDSQAEKEKNRLTTGTLTWENIDNKAEYKTKASGITVSTHAVYKLNPLGLGYVPTIPVKGKAGTTTRSAISKGTITITDKENQKQDIEKLNRNTEDSLNKLKEIFDKTKVEERKRLLEELGIVGNRTIHEIASHNGWKDGSVEKAALHGMLGAITGAKSGGSALSGLIAGGANEYAIGYLEKSKGKDWINKHPDTVQNISAAFGGILSKMTGGSGHTSAYISQMGTKWNDLDEELEAREVWERNINSNPKEIKELIDDLPEDVKRELLSGGSSYVTRNGISILAKYTIDNFPELVKKYPGIFEGVRFLGTLNQAYSLAMAFKWYAETRYKNGPDYIGYNEWLKRETGDDIDYLK